MNNIVQLSEHKNGSDAVLVFDIRGVETLTLVKDNENKVFLQIHFRESNRAFQLWGDEIEGGIVKFKEVIDQFREWNSLGPKTVDRPKTLSKLLTWGK